jgi:hypothetical protein
MPPPWRHLLLQGKESDGDKFKKSCLGSLYPANAEAIKMTCKFKVTDAREKFFELAENTWAIYSTGKIDTNQVCPTKNMIQPHQIKSGGTVLTNLGSYIRTMDYMISAYKSKTVEIHT